MSERIGVWMPVSDTLLADALPIGATINELLLRRLYAEHFGETVVDAVALVERGTEEWDDLIFVDEEWYGLPEWAA